MKKISFILVILSMAIACNRNGHTSDAYGNFESDETLVSSEMNGKLLSFTLNEGDQLSKGTVVGLVDTVMIWLQKDQLTAQRTKIVANLKSIDAQVAVLNQQKENLDIDLNRIKNMMASGAATQKQLDDITGQYKVIQDQIEATLAQKNAASKDMNVLNANEQVLDEQLVKCHISNPINGTVLEKYAEPGEVTAAGKPLYKIADLKTIILRVYVSGGQLEKVKIGNSCTVLIDQGKKEYKSYPGKISWVSDQAEFTPKIIQTKDERVNMVYAVKIDVPNDGAIKIGMPGEVLF